MRVLFPASTCPMTTIASRSFPPASASSLSSIARAAASAAADCWRDGEDMLLPTEEG